MKNLNSSWSDGDEEGEVLILRPLTKKTSGIFMKVSDDEDKEDEDFALRVMKMVYEIFIKISNDENEEEWRFLIVHGDRQEFQVFVTGETCKNTPKYSKMKIYGDEDEEERRFYFGTVDEHDSEIFLKISNDEDEEEWRFPKWSCGKEDFVNLHDDLKVTKMKIYFDECTRPIIGSRF